MMSETARLRKTTDFKRLRARLLEQRQCTDTIVKSAGDEVPRDASGHVHCWNAG